LFEIYEAIAKAQLAKDEAELKGIREQTLREVGTRLAGIAISAQTYGGFGEKAKPIIAELMEGRMP
jgi:hypothetical protein